MSLAKDITDNVTGYSKAMYSTWFYYKSERFLFDAGEGVSTSLGNSIFGIKNIFLSHGHYDHIGGLPGIVLTRNSAMGDKTKPLVIYYPKNDAFIENLKDYIKKCTYNLSYELTWQSVDSEEEINLDMEAKNRSIKTFPTNHIKSHLTLGYNLIEKRTRLKQEFASLSQDEIIKLVKEKGRTFITEEYEYVVLSYVGDSMPVNIKYIDNAEVLMHEASFLYEDERKYNIHSTLEETMELAKEANVKSLILYHISSRYVWEEVNKKLNNIIKKKKLTIPITVVTGGYFRKVNWEKSA